MSIIKYIAVIAISFLWYYMVNNSDLTPLAIQNFKKINMPMTFFVFTMLWSLITGAGITIGFIGIDFLVNYEAEFRNSTIGARPLITTVQWANFIISHIGNKTVSFSLTLIAIGAVTFSGSIISWILITSN